MRKLARLAGWGWLGAALLLGGGMARAQFVAGHTAEIYPDPAAARTEIAQALRTARAEHKNVILDFGGNWCGDCKVLNIYFHQEPNLSLLDRNFVLVDVNIGHMDANTDIAEHYEIPLHKGVPALAVLDEHGKLLYSQKGGEFESMRHMDPSSVTEFLNQWKPRR